MEGIGQLPGGGRLERIAGASGDEILIREVAEGTARLLRQAEQRLERLEGGGQA